MVRTKHLLVPVAFVMLLISIPVGDIDADDIDVARIGDIYFDDMNDAIDSAKAGDVVVIVSSTSIEKNVTIPTGVTLLIPYADATGNTDIDGTRDGESLETTTAKIVNESYRYLNVTIVEDVTVTIDGTLTVGGVLSRPFSFDYQGHTSAQYSQMTVDGTLTVNDGGTLNCYGFVKGAGTVKTMSGSSVFEPLIVTDYVGGDNAYNMYDGGQAPFNRFAFVNIQSEFIIAGGSHLYGLMNLYANNSYNKVTVNIIGQYEKDNALILLRDGASATVTYDEESYLEDVWTSNIHRDIGKTMISVTGGAVLDRMIITCYGRQMDTGNVEFSIPYNIDIQLDAGTYGIDCNFRILPGSTMTVGDDAMLHVNGSLTVYDGLDDVPFRDKYYPRTSTLKEYGFDVCGRLIVNGTMDILAGGRFAGTVECMSSDASVNVDANAGRIENVNVQYGVNNKASGMREGTDNITTRVLSATVLGDNRVIRMGANGTYVSLDGGDHIQTGYTYTRNGTSYTVDTEQTLNGTWKVTNTASEFVTVTSLPSADDVRTIFDEGKNAVFEIKLTDLYINNSLDTNILGDIPKGLHFDVVVTVGDSIVYRYSFHHDESYVADGEMDLRILRMASKETTERIESLMREVSPHAYILMDMCGGKPLPTDTKVTYSVGDILKEGQMIDFYKYDEASDVLESKGSFKVDGDGMITVTVDEACTYAISYEEDPIANGDMSMIIGLIAIIVSCMAIAAGVFFYLRRKGN